MDAENEEVVHPEQTEAEAIASFNAGFDSANPQTTPPAQVESEEPAPKEPDAPKYVQITEQDWTELRAKAASIDEIKAEHKRQFDSLNGNMGGMKQIVDGLKQRGGVKLTPGMLKRTAAEFPALEALLTDDLNEILSAPDQGKTFDPTEIDRRARALMDSEIPKVSEALKMEILETRHPDWKEDLRSDAFKAFQQTLTPAENANLMSSTDGVVVARFITAFKKRQSVKPNSQATVSSRQSRIESGVPAKGTGGSAPAPSESDEFEKGWKLRTSG